MGPGLGINILLRQKHQKKERRVQTDTARQHEDTLLHAVLFPSLELLNGEKKDTPDPLGRKKNNARDGFGDANFLLASSFSFVGSRTA
jgi:hypothetical protein